MCMKRVPTRTRMSSTMMETVVLTGLTVPVTSSTEVYILVYKADGPFIY